MIRCLFRKCIQETKVFGRFLSSSGLTESHLEIQAISRKFAKDFLAPIAAELDRKECFPFEQLSKLADLGFMAMTAPSEFGGSDLDFLSASLVVEELSRACASTGSIVSIHNILYADLLAKEGNESQKEKFLLPFTRGTPGAFALSESEAGSDVANISTTATQKGNYFLLNGTKAWVTSGIQAEVAVIFATIDKNLKHQGITAFLVPLCEKGVQRSQPDKKIGIRASSTCHLCLNDVTVPADNVIGTVGGGFKLAMQQLNKARIGIGSQALGIAQASLDLALDYASNRKAFGKLLKDFQAVKLRLARMSMQLEGARQLVRKAATMCDKGENFIKYSALGKLMASEAATFNSHQCIQILGGMGYLRDMPAERYYRDARITEIYGGVSDIQLMIISEQLFKEHESRKCDM